MSDFQVILLGNYAPDGQQSMLRFAEQLRQGWERRQALVALLQPTPHWRSRAGGRLARLGGAWDKFIRFPRQLSRHASGLAPGLKVVFHVCDHGNAHYRAALPGRCVVATCHDLIAARAALGELPLLPRPDWVARRRALGALRQLRKIPWIACDSAATRADFLRLTGRRDGQRVRVIPLSLNQAFRPLPPAESAAALAAWPALAARPFLLHVGDNEPRKNRALLPAILAQAVRQGWDGALALAGAPPAPGWWDEARRQGITERVIVIERPNTAALNALYASAHALVFPSLAEGFGLPVIEAFASGCPVICADTTSLPELGGDAAVLAPPTDGAAYANAVARLARDPAERAERVRRGLARAALYSEDQLFDGYAALYADALAEAR